MNIDLRTLSISFAALTLAACTTSTSTAASTSSSTSTSRAGLDDAAQAIVDEELVAALATPRVESALAVVLDPRDGRVLAMLARDARGPSETVPAQDVRPHGSVAKTLAIAIALDHGVVAPGDVFDGAPIALGGEIADHELHPSMSLEDVMAFSSNVGATHVVERLPAGALADGLAAFHLGARVPAEARTDLAVAVRVGYGATLSATPLEMATAVAAIANGGVLHAPWRTGETPTEGERVVSAEAAAATLALLEAAVAREDGTGHRAQIEGVRVAGKTGTVPLDEASTEGVFVGVVPSDAPRFVVLVDVVASGHDYSGGTLAAPVFARIASRLLAP